MGIHTMEEAVDGLTPQEVWARRAVYRNAKRILIDPTTSYEWNPRGYLERVAFKMGGYVQVLTADGDNGEIGNQFYLLFDETARLIEIEKRIDTQKDAT